jgi:hypothetical protein
MTNPLQTRLTGFPGYHLLLPRQSSPPARTILFPPSHFGVYTAAIWARL